MGNYHMKGTLSDEFLATKDWAPDTKLTDRRENWKWMVAEAGAVCQAESLDFPSAISSSKKWATAVIIRTADTEWAFLHDF